MMHHERTYYVYIMSSKYGVLYVGMSGDVYTRILQHKSKEQEGFTKKYNINKLVYYEGYQYVNDAIAREKQIKKWRRDKKENLIKEANPKRRDLFEDFIVE